MTVECMRISCYTCTSTCFVYGCCLTPGFLLAAIYFASSGGITSGSRRSDGKILLPQLYKSSDVASISAESNERSIRFT